MNELKAICEAFVENQKRGQRSALASVFYTSGSTYRRAGARMLIAEDGRTAGSISGGCLEADVVERALTVINTGRPLIVNYDTRSGDDIVWGLGLGCQGVVEILIENLPDEQFVTPISFFEQVLTARETCILVTVVGVTADIGDVRAGDRLMLMASGIEFNQIKNAALSLQVKEHACMALATRKSQIRLYGPPSQEVKVFIEVIEPQVPLVIFGAGQDALPVMQFSRKLGWHVTIVDTRARKATRERFQEADEIVLCRPEEIEKHLEIGPRTAIVMMSHNFLDDLELLERLLPLSVRYLGILGPRRRSERLFRELDERGSLATQVMFSSLYSPVGIDIGADTPEEIALSIVAEIQAVSAGRTGSFLKDRRSPIHSHSDETSPIIGQSLRLKSDDVLFAEPQTVCSSR